MSLKTERVQFPLTESTLNNFALSAQRFNKLLKYLAVKSERHKSMRTKGSKELLAQFETCRNFNEAVAEVFSELYAQMSARDRQIKRFEEKERVTAKYLKAIGHDHSLLKWMQDADFRI